MTFVVTSDGRVAETFGGRAVSPADNVQMSLEAVQRLAGN
jgi:peroxiredoxin